jgi:hypothetical protein
VRPSGFEPETCGLRVSPDACLGTSGDISRPLTRTYRFWDFGAPDHFREIGGIFGGMKSIGHGMIRVRLNGLGGVDSHDPTADRRGP